MTLPQACTRPTPTTRFLNITRSVALYKGFFSSYSSWFGFNFGCTWLTFAYTSHPAGGGGGGGAELGAELTMAPGLPAACHLAADAKKSASEPERGMPS